MEHIAIDLGARESQVCVRRADGEIVEERRIATRPSVVRRYLAGRPKSRVIVETGSEAFWVAQIAIGGANPINAFALWIRLRFRLIQGRFACGVDFLDAPAIFFRFFFCQLALPAHFPGDLRLGFRGVAVFIQQFHVLFRACVALFHELLVIKFVPGLLGVLLPALVLLDGLG